MKTPLRIAIMMMGGYGWIGGVEYVRNLILALGHLTSDERKSFELSLVTEKNLDESLTRQLSPYLDKIILLEEVLQRQTFLNRLRLKYLKGYKDFVNPYLYDFLKREKFDFVYPYFEVTKDKNDFAWASWIPDFQHKHLPQYFTAAEIAYRDKYFLQLTQYAKTLVLSSKSAASDCERFFPGGTETKILSFKTTPNPDWFTQNPEGVQKKYHLPDRFFIVCNQFWQHKNHLIIFKALELLKKRDIKPVIVCTGHVYDHRQPEYFDSILQTIHKSDLVGQVFLLGVLPKNEQIQLLRRSIAVLQPSLFEGWSTIVEDARCLGKPMILSDFSVHLEQNPPDCIFFERMSPQALMAAMIQCWQTSLPGPNLELEAKARDVSKYEVRAFAHEFLKLAGSAEKI